MPYHWPTCRSGVCRDSNHHIHPLQHILLMSDNIKQETNGGCGCFSIVLGCLLFYYFCTGHLTSLIDNLIHSTEPQQAEKQQND